MIDQRIIKISQAAALKDRAAAWFHEKWSIPLTAYLESMEQAIVQPGGVPEWYLVLEDDRILGGAGVIENDFHDRKDLTPNVCAVYVEEAVRCRGIAGKLLNFICQDMADRGIPTLYLLTDHTGFYERYAWEFFCMAQGDGEETPSRMYIHRS